MSPEVCAQDSTFLFDRCHPFTFYSGHKTCRMVLMCGHTNYCQYSLSPTSGLTHLCAEKAWSEKNKIVHCAGEHLTKLLAGQNQ